MRTITFYSYKGGVGRTLAVPNVARYLARFGQRVVALDFDLEAPGLHYKLSLPGQDRPLPIKKGLLDYLHAFCTESRAPQAVKEFVVPVPLPPTTKGTLHLMAAGLVPSVEYWQKLAQISWHELFYSAGARGIPLFLELKERIREELDADFLLIDSRTGITEIGGVATTVLPDKVVCFLLHNLENLEGARAVLRSIRRTPRPPGADRIEIIPILARIPSAEDQEAEHRIVARVQDYLNEEAERLEDTLAVSELFVLHSEPGLQLAERLHIGGTGNGEESELLRDYLRLFARLVPEEVVRPHVGSLIKHVKEIAFEDPDGAQLQLENLARYFGHPDVSEELLKLYRLRNIEGDTVLSTAQSLWNVSNQADNPLLWDAVRKHFKETPRDLRTSISLRFIEEVWRAAGASDVRVGLALAESYDNHRDSSHAADLLVEMSENIPEDESQKVIARCIGLLVKSKRWDKADEIIEKWRTSLAHNSAFLTQWATLEAIRPGPVRAEELLGSSVLERISARSPQAAYRLLRKAGREDDANELVDQMLVQALEEGLSSNLVEVGSLFAALGRAPEFEQAVRSRLGPDDAGQLLRYVAREEPERFRRYVRSP